MFIIKIRVLVGAKSIFDDIFAMSSWVRKRQNMAFSKFIVFVLEIKVLVGAESIFDKNFYHQWEAGKRRRGKM